jgi:YD repeat-containing protein
MKDTYNLSEFGSFTRVRQIAVAMLFALTLAGPPRLWGQCNPDAPKPTSISVSVSPGTVVGGSTTVVTANITLNSAAPQITFVGLSVTGATINPITPLYYGQAVIPCGDSSVSVTFTVNGVNSPTTATFSVGAYGAGASAPLQVTQNGPTLSLSPGSLIGGSTQTATATVTMTAPVLNYTLVGITQNGHVGGGAIEATNLVNYGEDLAIGSGQTSGTFTIWANGVTQPTIVTIGASAWGITSTVPLAVTQNTPTLSVTPGSLDGGSTQTATGKVTMAAPVLGYTLVAITQNGVVGGVMNFHNLVNYGEDLAIGYGGQSAQFKMTAGAVSHPTPVTIGAYAWGFRSTQTLEVLTAGSSANPANGGVCKQCQAHGGHPINLTTGNVWIQQHDYSVPGLGGGLELSRVWNSLWAYEGPPALAGMFGSGWRSTYEEQLMPLGTGSLIYWRGDGSGWTFTYNSVLNSYSLSSPPDERAQLVMNPATGGFTLTFADGTQKVFNNQDLLAAVIDRNNNQTSLAYDIYNRLTSVTSPGGATLTFTYGDPNNPLQATTVQDSVGLVATYTYDSSSRLTKVSYPDGSALNFTNDPNSSMILSVTDSQGKLLEAHTYDAQNRGLTSTRAYGVDSVSVTY